MKGSKRTGAEMVNVLSETVAAVESHGGTVSGMQFQEHHCDHPDAVHVVAGLSSWDSILTIFDDLSIDPDSIQVHAPEEFRARLYIGVKDSNGTALRIVVVAFIES